MKITTTMAALILVVCAEAAHSANLSKTYSYFSIGGDTLDEIEAELSKRGPQIESTGRRHPGATRMEFTAKLKFAQDAEGCKLAGASVSVKAKVILPRWRKRKQSQQEVRLFWDTLSSDIRRHEEGHTVIAKNHAREIEQALKRLGPQEDCDAIAASAIAARNRILEKHDKAQAAFDRVEGKNFESRMLRLLKYRAERIGDGRLPG